MLNDRIKALIRDYNPWWGGKVPGVPEYRRHIYVKVERFISPKQIIAVTGLRRVGKTVLLRQLMSDIIKDNNENVFYFLFDDLLTNNPDVLEDVINYFLKTVAKDGRKYVFLDEIQKVPYWQDILKRFYDTREDVKFIVTGSASLQIKKSKESLAGRIFDFYMPPLTFREFLELNGMQIEQPNLSYESLEEVYEKNINRRPEIESLFSEYIIKGAFPEMVKETDLEVITNYIKNTVIDKIIFEDIPIVYEVRRKEILYSILEYACRETSNILDVTKLAQTLNVHYETARDYLFYLHDSFVLDLVYNHSKSAASQLRKNKKIHVAHPCISIALMRYSRESVQTNELFSKYVETIVFQHARLLSERVSFWRTPQKDEVDIILEDPFIPIEVKYRSKITSDDYKSVEKFLDKQKLKKGFIISRNEFRRDARNGKEIIIAPVWLFLLTAG